jgi:plastocyanin
MRKTQMRKSIIAPLALAVPLALLGAAPAETATQTVRVGDNWFVRAAGVPTVTVRRGDRVRWRWTGSSPHNVTVTSGPTKFRSRTQSSGSFTRRVTRAGTYRIICTVHGARDQSMRLRVR